MHRNHRVHDDDSCCSLSISRSFRVASPLVYMFLQGSFHPQCFHVDSFSLFFLLQENFAALFPSSRSFGVIFYFASFPKHSHTLISASQMSTSGDFIITTPTDQVSVNVVRKSDGQSLTFVLDEKTHVHHLKDVLRLRLPPRYEQGCRLIFREKVLKGKHSLKHYGIKKGVDDQTILSMSQPISLLQIVRSSLLFSGRFEGLEFIVVIIGFRKGILTLLSLKICVTLLQRCCPLQYMYTLFLANKKKHEMKLNVLHIFYCLSRVNESSLGREAIGNHRHFASMMHRSREPTTSRAVSATGLGMISNSDESIRKVQI